MKHIQFKMLHMYVSMIMAWWHR